MRRLRHGRVELVLSNLRPGDSTSRPLLLLHELGGSAATAPLRDVEAWPGPVWGLDFTGHGGSSVPAGGGYTAETLMADADAALASLGEASLGGGLLGGVTVVGWGLGAYVALLIAGARPTLVKGAILGDGRGLAGGGPQGGDFLIRPDFEPGGPPDPFALRELENDARPPGYAQLFVRQAVHLSGVVDPIAVAARARPPWLGEAVSQPGVVASDLAEALCRFVG